MKHDCIKPKQIDFLTLIQWLDLSKNIKSKFNITIFKNGYRLVPYGNDIYGMYKKDGYDTFDKFYNLNIIFNEKNREDYNNPIAIIKFNRNEYKKSLDDHNKYWNWFDNKNEKRFSNDGTFDQKQAMHNVRLLRTGLEILQTGEVHVKRPDAKELLNIRHGSMTYDELIEYADYMDNEIKSLYKVTDLPKYPDLKYAANILMNIQNLMWEK